MNENPGAFGDLQGLQSKDFGLGGLAHGRRVTLGGMNRRSSLGMAEALFNESFGRRSSGFGDFDITRRGSMDSTSAVLDAAIMDLTRRRLSMAMSIPGDMGGMGDPYAGMPSLGSLDPLNTFGPMGMGSAGMGSAAQFPSSLSAPAPAASSMMGSRESMSISARQKQLQEQQLELERRQKELEVQRQQLVSAMEERRHVMQQMQQKMGGAMPNMGSVSQFRRSSLGVFGGMGFPGMNPMGSNGLMPSAIPSSMQGNADEPSWHVCKLCNSKAFPTREDLVQHESLCSADKMRRSSIGASRRSSLDLLVSTLEQTEASDKLKMSSQIRDSDLGFGTDRRFSLTAGAGTGNDQPLPLSTGPFAMIENPISLSMPSDKDWLTPLHCFVRGHCVQVFTATEADVSTPSKGKRKQIHVGQVGIRCPHCHHDDSSQAHERGSIYYPTSVASIYNATMNLLQRHLHTCSSVPEEIMKKYETLKGDDARSGTSKKYWAESALSLGLVDTLNGIRYSAATPPPLPVISQQQQSTGVFSSARRSSNEFFSSNSNATAGIPIASANGNARLFGTQGISAEDNAAEPAKKAAVQDKEELMTNSSPLVMPEDEPYATGFSFHLLSQMQPCVFTEADRLGKRKGLPPGFPGLACRHCFGGYGSGRFFPSSIKTLSDTSKTLNVLHNHMMRCRKCPPEIRENLDKLRKTHDEERGKMKFGSQKAFFARIWDRLHFKDPTVNAKRKFQPSLASPPTSKGLVAASASAPGVPGLMGSDIQQEVLDAMTLQKFGGFMDAKRRKM